MLIPSAKDYTATTEPSLSRRVNANSQPTSRIPQDGDKLIKKGEC